MFYVVPLLTIATWAFGVGADRSITETIHRVASSEYYRSRILFTFTQATLSTLLTLLIGVPLSYIFATRDFPARRFLRAAFTVPFVMPPLVLALALQAFVGRGSIIADAGGTTPLDRIGPIGAILLAHAIYNVSLIVRIVGAAWEHFPASYAEAAATLGASSRRTFWTIRMPLALPAITAAAILVFLFCASSFGIILLLGGDRLGTLETLIYEEVASFRPHYDVASLLGLLQLFTTLAAVILYVVVSRRARATYTPRVGAHLARPSTVQWTVLALGTFLVLGPFITLFLEAFRYRGQWSIEPVVVLFRNELPVGPASIWNALGNSLAFATLTLLIALPLAWASLKAFQRNSRAAAIWTTFLLVPLGTSAVLLALGYILAFNGQVLPDLRAHPSRIILAHVLIAYPFTTRILSPAMDALNPALSEAARSLGARVHHLLLRVELPLLRPALLAAGVFAFATSLGEFGATLLLRRPEYQTLPLALFDGYSRPGEAFRAQAEVIALLLAIVALVAFWIMERARKGTEGDLL